MTTEDDKLIEKVEDEIRAGIDAMGKSNDEARYHYQRALSYLEDIEDEERRRQELGVTALTLVRSGFPDLAAPAAREAIVLDEKAGDLRHLGEDLIAYGIAEMGLGQLGDAAQYFKRALEVCEGNGDYDNAASASTNLAILIGQDEHRLREAIKLLRNSLSYLLISA